MTEDAGTNVDGMDASGEPVAEPRGCAFCGALIDPRAHRCSTCCGHVGLAWGTVHKEHWLFIFTSVLIAVGCVASWNGRTYGGPEQAASNGLDTIRGTMMFAIAIHAVIVGIFNVLYRRMVLWPFVLNAFLALWVGLGGFASIVNGPAWKSWAKMENPSLPDKFLGGIRAVPPGFLLLALAGILVLFKLLAGLLAAAGKGKKAAPPARKSSGRKRDDLGGTSSPADESIPPAP